MKREIGVWIDHRKAVVAAPVKMPGNPFHVEADTYEYKRISNGLRSDKTAGSMDRLEQDGYQRNVQEHLARYYDEVIARIGETDSILIFGPGEAKVELKKRIGMEKPLWHIVGTEPADKMTDNEVVEKVLRHFSHKTMDAGQIQF